MLNLSSMIPFGIFDHSLMRFRKKTAHDIDDAGVVGKTIYIIGRINPLDRRWATGRSSTLCSPKYAALRGVQNRSTRKRSINTAIADGESPALKIRQIQAIFLDLPDIVCITLSNWA